MGEILKQDSLGRVRTPLEKRAAIVEAFEAGGMSAARFARHQRRQNPPLQSAGGGAMRWIEAVVEGVGDAEPRQETSGLCMEWRGARMRIETPTQARLAAALIRELEGAAC